MEKTRLALAIENGIAKITTAKNWVNPTKNPNGWQMNFKIVDGCQIIPGTWERRAKEG